MTSSWYVYMVRCADNSLYTGITTNLSRRIDEHNNSPKLSAKYTRTRRPVRLVYSKKACSRSDASKQEYGLKQLNKQTKEKLIKDF